MKYEAKLILGRICPCDPQMLSNVQCVNMLHVAIESEPSAQLLVCTYSCVSYNSACGAAWLGWTIHSAGILVSNVRVKVLLKLHSLAASLYF